ncbi:MULTISPECIES: FadR/GntR family transcriptional regulator [Komagataeibacter]|nr:FadR/GntR family transcriptional regulator [Komagataeibacter saccharivorans]
MNASGNLSENVADELLRRIQAKTYMPGEKLPSTAVLCTEFDVSRTVIREAIASLKLGGRIVTRQGAGTFVTTEDRWVPHFLATPIDDVRAALEILELRIGVETQAAFLAAQRKTAQSLAHLYQMHAQFVAVDTRDPEMEVRADLDFHLAIARAAGNPRFPAFLGHLVSDISRDLFLKYAKISRSLPAYLDNTKKEHQAILEAISRGNAEQAQKLMRRHLEGSLNRYRKLLEVKIRD